MKDFAAEIRASLDVENFLNSAVLLLDMADTSLDSILDRMLGPLITKTDEPNASVADAKKAIFIHDSGETPATHIYKSKSLLVYNDCLFQVDLCCDQLTLKSHPLVHIRLALITLQLFLQKLTLSLCVFTCSVSYSIFCFSQMLRYTIKMVHLFLNELQNTEKSNTTTVESLYFL